MPYSHMKQYRQWLLWRLDGKIKKPVSPYTGIVCDNTNPANHCSFDEAVVAMHMFPGTQLAFAVVEGGPLFFGDLDGCLMPDGTWSPTAQHFLSLVPGALVEVSHSGRGLHVIGVMAAAIAHACKNTALKLELYTGGRFIAMGNMDTAVGDSSTVVDLTQLVMAYFQPGATRSDVEWTDGPCDDSNPMEADQDLIEAACKSKSAGSAFGNKASFNDLWTGNVAALAIAYPTQNDADPYDMSGADAALASHLSFWTGKDCVRMERLMGNSALGLRDKWVSREDYRRVTISSACARNTQTFGTPKPDAPLVGDTETLYRPACNIINQTIWPEFFAPYIYLEKPHRMFDRRTGGTLSPVSFKARLGGHYFNLDNEKSSTTDAFKAFTETSLFYMPKVHDAMFRPDLPVGQIFNDGVNDFINDYVPNVVTRKHGDVSRFLGHIFRMYPIGNDAKIIVCYLAALLQNPGKKFQWAPVLVGAQGNGKTWLADLIALIVGLQFTRKPNSNDIANKFNEWLVGTLFAIIEELDVKGNKETLDAVKTMLTNERMEVQGKGKDQVTSWNFANFLILTNELTGVPINDDSRRFCVMVSAQMNAKDVLRDYQEPNYFRDLWNWTRDGDVVAGIADFLLNMKIDPMYDPSTDCSRAPKTSHTAAAIAASLGIVEQEILGHIEEERAGFSGGWVSSLAINKLIKERHWEHRLPRSKRLDMMKALGYVRHPALGERGRPNNPVPGEGGKPVLYIKEGHLSLNLCSCGEVVAAYMRAQGYAQFGEANNE